MPSDSVYILVNPGSDVIDIVMVRATAGTGGQHAGECFSNPTLALDRLEGLLRAERTRHDAQDVRVLRRSKELSKRLGKLAQFRAEISAAA